MNIKVLLADDHKIMRDGLKAILDKAEDIEVVAEAEDGNEAVRKALETRPDVIVMDLTMPQMGGIEATRCIIKVEPSARILALSMLQEKSCVVESLKAGAKGFLIKNCAGEELLVAIRTLAAGESYLCTTIIDLVIQDYARISPNDPVDPVSHPELSKREMEVLRLIADGKSTKEIAYELEVSIKTIDVQRYNIMKKLNLYSIAALTKYAVREGLTSIE